MLATGMASLLSCMAMIFVMGNAQWQNMYIESAGWGAVLTNEDEPPRQHHAPGYGIHADGVYRAYGQPRPVPPPDSAAYVPGSGYHQPPPPPPYSAAYFHGNGYQQAGPAYSSQNMPNGANYGTHSWAYGGTAAGNGQADSAGTYAGYARAAYSNSPQGAFAQPQTGAYAPYNQNMGAGAYGAYSQGQGGEGNHEVQGEPGINGNTGYDTEASSLEMGKANGKDGQEVPWQGKHGKGGEDQDKNGKQGDKDQGKNGKEGDKDKDQGKKGKRHSKKGKASPSPSPPSRASPSPSPPSPFGNTTAVKNITLGPSGALVRLEARTNADSTEAKVIVMDDQGQTVAEGLVTLTSVTLTFPPAPEALDTPLTATIAVPPSGASLTPQGALLAFYFMLQWVAFGVDESGSQDVVQDVSPFFLPTSTRDGRRRGLLDNPGCDFFPDAACALGCCAEHDRCFATYQCSAVSWLATVCQGVKLPSVLTLPKVIGKLTCTVATVFTRTKCVECNNAVMGCIIKGCIGFEDPETTNLCYDRACNSYFDCPVDCELFSTQECCNCPEVYEVGDDCNQVMCATGDQENCCGNFKCETLENRQNCYLDCMYNNCPNSYELQCGSDCVDVRNDNSNCGVCGQACECENGLCYGGVPLEISWKTSATGGGSWYIVNDGRTIRYEVQNSENCGGTNSNTQEGTAFATIQLKEPHSLTPIIQGWAELQDGNYENLELTVDGMQISKSTSTNLDLGCDMGPAVTTLLVPLPLSLPAGEHALSIDFTTSDGLFHVGSFYEINLIFAPLNIPS